MEKNDEMNLQEFRRIISAIAQTIDEDDTISITYDDGLLHFAWKVDDNHLIKSVKCRFDGEVEFYGTTSLNNLFEIEKSCNDLIQTTPCCVGITPTHIEVYVGDFRFTLGATTEEPEDGNSHKYFRAIAEFDQQKWQILIAAAHIAAKGIGGVSINCFSNIMEITTMNNTIVMYKYINLRNQVAKPFSFNIEPEAILLLDSVRTEGIVVGIRADARQKNVLLMFGNERQVTSILTRILPGRYSYPKIPINNLGTQRLLVDKQELVESLDKKFKKYYCPSQIRKFSLEQILSDYLSISVKNGFASIESHDGDIHCAMPVEKRTPQSLVLLDAKQLCTILKDIEGDQIYLILPEKEHHPLVIETDNCQYALSPLIKRSHCPVNLDHRSFDEPLFKEVLATCPGLRGEGMMETAIVDFHHQQHIFEQWEILDRRFKLKYSNSEAVEAFTEMLMEQIEDLCGSLKYLCKLSEEKGIVDTPAWDLIQKLRFYLESEFEEDITPDSLKTMRLLLNTGLALREVLLLRCFGIERTFRVETITCF